LNVVSVLPEISVSGLPLTVELFVNPRSEFAVPVLIASADETPVVPDVSFTLLSTVLATVIPVSPAVSAATTSVAVTAARLEQKPVPAASVPPKAAPSFSSSVMLYADAGVITTLLPVPSLADVIV
jgi:cytoskeletal protein RodZ